MIEIGQKSPKFNGIDQNENLIQLDDFKGKKVVLYFYPKDSTPGCTAESCNLRDNIDSLNQKGFEVIGVSADSVKRHQNFATKNALPFSLIADTDKKIINAFGVWGPKKFMGKEYEGIHRKTFVIDENGVVERIFEKVKTKAHAEQILETY